MECDFDGERPGLDTVPDSKGMTNHNSSFGCIFNTIDTIIGDDSCYAGDFRDISSRNVFGGGPASIMSSVDGSFCGDPTFAAKFLEKASFSALMADEASDANAILNSGRSSGENAGSGRIGGRTVSLLNNSGDFSVLDEKNGVNSTGWGHLDPSKLGIVPPGAWATLPSDPEFVERAVKYSSFGNGERSPHENVSGGVSNLQPVAQQPGRENGNVSKCTEDGIGKKRKAKSTSSAQTAKEAEESKTKRCRMGENSESDDNTYRDNEDTSDSTPKKGKEKNSKPVQKDDNFIHVRARRGQATDSHSLAERVRREKINERMKFLQDLVPTCNKVTGKAVMLDEIINYVQSLQHQVEFLSMKLATVNPKLDFNMDSFFSKEMCGGFTNKGVPSPYFHLDPFKQASLHTGPTPGSDIITAITTGDSVEMFDVGNFQRQSPSGGNSELQNMYNMGMLQGRLQQQQQGPL